MVAAASAAGGASGVNGSQSDMSAPQAGAAYVFRRAGATWKQQAYVKASNPRAQGRFGVSVAVSGDSVVVGSAGDASGARGVNGDQADTSAAGAGAVYVLR